MPQPVIGNQQAFSGNYGEIFLHKFKIGGFQNWTFTYSANIQPEGQIGTGTPILVPGLISATVTGSKLMLFDQSISALGLEPAQTLNDVGTIVPFTAALFDRLAHTMIKAVIGCLFDSNTITASANQAYRETFTFMGVDAQGTGGMTNA